MFSLQHFAADAAVRAASSVAEHESLPVLLGKAETVCLDPSFATQSNGPHPLRVVLQILLGVLEPLISLPFVSSAVPFLKDACRPVLHLGRGGLALTRAEARVRSLTDHRTAAMFAGSGRVYPSPFLRLAASREPGVVTARRTGKGRCLLAFHATPAPKANPNSLVRGFRLAQTHAEDSDMPFQLRTLHIG